MRNAVVRLLRVLVFACVFCWGGHAAPTAAVTQPSASVLTIVWVARGDLYHWRQDDPVPRTLASGGVIKPFLAPDARHIAFTRGAQGDARSLWVVAADGSGEQELVPPDLIPSLRGGHPQIAQVGWLDAQTLYFNTLQQRSTGDIPDDNLYRAALDADPQLILPPGAGGAFAFAPNGEWIAVASAGLYDTLKGHVTLLDPAGVTVVEAFQFTGLRAPSELPLYPPFSWHGESTFVRVPVASRDTDRVPLWRIPLEGDAQIFGYVSADPAGLPVWSSLPGGGGDQMLYLRAASPASFDLVLADANGENAEIYASGVVADPRWLPQSDRFIYTDDDVIWLGRRGEAPRRIFDSAVSEIVFAGEWVLGASAGGILAHNAVTGERLLLSGLVAVPFDASLAA